MRRILYAILALSILTLISMAAPVTDNKILNCQNITNCVDSVVSIINPQNNSSVTSSNTNDDPNDIRWGSSHGSMGNDSQRAGADMVSDGIDGWLSKSADSMIGITDDMNANQPKRSSGEMALFGMITVSYDPFQNPGVVKILQNTSIIFLFLFVLFVFGGMAYVIIHSKYPQTGEALDYALNMEKGFDYKEYFKTLGSVIIFMVFGFLAVYVVLLISQVLGEMMSITALDATVYSPNSATIYFIMAIAYLILSIFIGIRLLVISIITALLFILFALWAFHIMRDVITQIFIYFATMIFMQPILISIAAIGIMTIEWLLGGGILQQATYILYLGLVIIMLIVALVLTLGPVTVQKLFRWGVRAI